MIVLNLRKGRTAGIQWRRHAAVLTAHYDLLEQQSRSKHSFRLFCDGDGHGKYEYRRSLGQFSMHIRDIAALRMLLYQSGYALRLAKYIVCLKEVPPWCIFVTTGIL